MAIVSQDDRDGLGQRVESLRAQALRRPDDAVVLCDLGNALVKSRRPEEGEKILRKALVLAPDQPRLYSNLGLALGDLGRWDEALEALLECVHREPRWATAHNNLAHLYILMGRHEDAITCADVALTLNPAYAAARRNRALAHLSLGQFELGWPDYDWCAFGVEQPVYPPPVWQGESLAGKQVLLTAQQGLGDTLQFVRYAEPLRRRARRMTLEVPLPLAQVLRTVAGIDEIVIQGEPLPAADLLVPLLGLPRMFGTTLETIPQKVPYLTANPERVAAWRERLVSMTKPGKFLVGIAWQGNPNHQWDQFRSAPLAAFAPLSSVPGVRLVSLQRGPGIEQIAASAMHQTLLVPTDGRQTTAEHLADTAALMMVMNLVVTVDTATAHLAGALGRPVWLALSVACDWRWMTARQDSPWYPNMRLFRQKKIHEWNAVFQEMAREMATIAK